MGQFILVASFISTMYTVILKNGRHTCQNILRSRKIIVNGINRYIVLQKLSETTQSSRKINWHLLIIICSNVFRVEVTVSN